MLEYVVLRIVNKPDGTTNAPVRTFDNEVEARKEFYRLCGAAVDSTNLTDSVSLLNKQGFEIEHKCFEH